MKIRSVCLSLIVLLAFATAAAAGPIVQFDQSLGGPGWYNGTGNPNGGFTVSTDNGVEIGLRAKARLSPNVIHSATNVYQVEAGPQISGPPNRAWWNYEFSINLQDSNLVLDDIYPYSTLTVENLTQGLSNTVAFPYWLDNATYGPSGENLAGPTSTEWGLQNSQNPSFGDFPLSAFFTGVPFNMDAEDYYRFTINVFDDSQRLLNSNSIDVAIGDATQPPSTVPEPASMTLLGVGVAGLIFRRHRRQQKTAA